MQSTMSTKKRNTVTLKKNCELIDVAKKNPHQGSRTLAEKFGCGKTQVNTILSKRESILEQREVNVSNDSVRLGKRTRTCQFAEIMNPFSSGIH